VLDDVENLVGTRSDASSENNGDIFRRAAKDAAVALTRKR